MTDRDEICRQVDGRDEGQALQGPRVLDRALEQRPCPLGFAARREREPLQRLVVLMDELPVSVDRLIVPVPEDFEQLDR